MKSLFPSRRFRCAGFLLGLLLPVFAHAFQANGQIADDSGNPIALHAVNWFGFDNAGHVAAGLWARNWQEMIAQMKASGINAVRIPVCPATIHGAGVSTVNYNLNPDLKGLDSLHVLDLFVQAFDTQQMYVLLDFHDTTCTDDLDPLWYTPAYAEQQWIADLVFLATRYKSIPHVLGWDLKNEPHGVATWGTGNNATDWNKAAERAAAAVLAVAPRWLVFVEGVQDNPNNQCQADPGTIQHLWGENLEPFRCAPLNIPKDRLVLAPHIYGPHRNHFSIFDDPGFPGSLAKVYDATFGYLAAQGYTIAPTEFGGQYHEGDPREDAFEEWLMDYFSARGISSVFYWAWNANGWPQGGLLKPDWKTVNFDKLGLMQRLWGPRKRPKR